MAIFGPNPVKRVLGSKPVFLGYLDTHNPVILVKTAPKVVKFALFWAIFDIKPVQKGGQKVSIFGSILVPFCHPIDI